MKTKLLFALFLTLSFITSAQRIDYALNHQEGLTHLFPYLVKVTSTNQLLVAYRADDEFNISSNYISLVNPDGTIQLTSALFSSENDVIIDMEETPMGVVVFSKSTIIRKNFYVQQIDAKWLTGLNYSGRKILYYNDSLEEPVQFAYKNNNYAIHQIKADGASLVTGTINHQSKEITQQVYPLDSTLNIYPFRFDWVSGTKKNLLNFNAVARICVFEFDSAMQLVNQKEMMNAYGDLAVFKNKLFNLSTTGKVGDSIFRSYLKDSLLHTIYTFKKGVIDNRKYGASLLFANANSMYTLTDFKSPFSSIDTILLTRFDSNLTATSYNFSEFMSTNLDGNEQGLVALLGRYSTDLVLYVLDENGLKTGIEHVNFIASSNITSYPNPFCNTLNFSGVGSNTTIQLFNTQGQVVLSANQAQNIDVSHLPSGLYFYQLIDAQKTKMAQGKLIKQ